MQFKEYTLGNQYLRFYIDEKKKTAMNLVPVSQKDNLINGWEVEGPAWCPTAPYIRQWYIGRLVHFHLSHHGNSMNCGNAKKYLNLNQVYFEDQVCEVNDGVTIIKTTLKSEEGHKIVNYIKHKEGYNALWSWNEFTNTSDKEVILDYIASFALENLSPFATDDSHERMKLHRFRGGWSKEGRYIVETFEHLGLEKGWQGCCNEHSERYGSLGSYPNQEFMPLSVIEDNVQNVFWVAQVYQNSSWQMEVTRNSDCISFSGGIADRDFGQWYKKLAPGESFTTPIAAISSSDDNLDYACQRVVKLQEEARKAYGEEGLPIAFNEFCTTWANPTQESFMMYAKKAAEFGAKYVIIDDGWSIKYNGKSSFGGWEINKEIFPDMKAMNKELREMGLIPGIWFELEVTTPDAKEAGPEFDNMHLKKDGYVIRSIERSFWDMNNPKVIAHLKERVIDMLRDNGFGYIKVDYNANLGIGCDGCESLGEGLRRQTEASRNFFKLMKKEIPDLIIECCASGGHRNEPSMLAVSALCSTTDAHESIEIPIISANLHRHILPTQASIWCVLHGTDSDERMYYSLNATLLGRLCFSGYLTELSEHQEEIIHSFVNTYKKIDNILKYGYSRIYRYTNESMRNPRGTQVVTRHTDDEMIIVAHAFEEPYSEAITVDIPEGFVIEDTLGHGEIKICGNKATISPLKRLTSIAVYAVKK